MSYRLLALDIDGTLTNSRGELTERTIQAVKLAVSRGVLVCLVSGRRPRGMRGIAAELELSGPLIACNGGAVVDARTMETFHAVTIPKTVVAPIIKAWEGAGISYCAFRATGALPDIYYCQPSTWAWEAEWLAGEGAQAVRLDSLLGETDWEPTHLHFGHYIEQVRQAEELVRPHIDPSQLRAFLVENHHQGIGYYEIYPADATKTNGLRFLGDYYGISSEEMVAVGDQFNDLDMIEYAGLGVAMGNAPLGVQEKADLVIGHHDEDGLAVFIEGLVKDGLLHGTDIQRAHAQAGDAR